MHLKFRKLPDTFAICRLPPNAPAPSLSETAAFTSITRTADELSIVCPAKDAPASAICEAPWTCFKLQGPFSFLTNRSFVIFPRSSGGAWRTHFRRRDFRHRLHPGEGRVSRESAGHIAGCGTRVDRRAGARILSRSKNRGALLRRTGGAAVPTWASVMAAG